MTKTKHSFFIKRKHGVEFLLQGLYHDFFLSVDMRIISGVFKGRTLFCPKNIKEDIRPTKDFTKEAVFNIMQFDIEGSIFLDIFSGTGSMGIEALSRRAKFVIFVDNQVCAIEAIKKNIENLNIDKNSYAIIKADANKFLSQSQKYLEGPYAMSPFNFIYADPPYNSSWYTDSLNYLDSCQNIDHNTFIMIEKRRSHESIISKDLQKTWSQKSLRKYGKSFVEILEKKE